MFKRVGLILIVLVISFGLFAQFNSKKRVSKPTTKQQITKQDNNSGISDKSFLEKNTEQQRTVRTKLSRAIRNIKKKDGKNYLMLALGLSFLYGIIHSLGPGHGKIFMVGQVLASKVKPLSIIGSSVTFAFLHALSGLTLVGILKLLSISLMKGSTQFAIIAQNIFFGILIALGIYMLIQAIINKDSQSHSHGHSKNLYVTAVMIGFVPCPGSIIIAVYAMKMAMFTTGLFMILSMALGMSVTLIMINFVAHYAKTVSALTMKSETKLKTFSRVFKFIGAILIIAMGTIFLIASY